MQFQSSLLLPLVFALTYVIGALTVRRAAAHGVGVWRTNFLSNWVIVLLFLPVWVLGAGPLHPLADYAQPLITAGFFFGGQALTFFALSRGDVSVVTPVMGAKVVFVALFSSLLRAGEVPLQWWLGALLSTMAISLLHLGGKAERRNVGQTVALTFCSAGSFSLSDVLIQKWVPAWGLADYAPPMFLFVGLLSCAFVPFFHAPFRTLDVAAWRWVTFAAVLMGVTNAGMILALVVVGNATAVNIVFSIRGLFSVLLVWSIGHWFASEERHLAGGVLGMRLLGAVLMVAAIVLVLI